MKNAKAYQEHIRQLDTMEEEDTDRDSLYEEDVDGMTFYAVGTAINTATPDQQ
jgi:hypothetical protein